MSFFKSLVLGSNKPAKLVETESINLPVLPKLPFSNEKKGIEVKKAIEKETGRTTLEPASGTGLPTDADDGSIGVAPGEKEAPVYSFRIGTEREGPVVKARREKAEDRRQNREDKEKYRQDKDKDRKIKKEDQAIKRKAAAQKPKSE